MLYCLFSILTPEERLKFDISVVASRSFCPGGNMYVDTPEFWKLVGPRVNRIMSIEHEDVSDDLVE